MIPQCMMQYQAHLELKVATSGFKLKGPIAISQDPSHIISVSALEDSFDTCKTFRGAGNVQTMTEAYNH